jgi:hypothetical protein
MVKKLLNVLSVAKKFELNPFLSLIMIPLVNGSMIRKTTGKYVVDVKRKLRWMLIN